jgi:hypothetical protein
MNMKLISMVRQLEILLNEDKYFEAIELNKKIAKVLKTYEISC